ncbi:unnamed protein product [Lactuca saligna]|uniref:Uncharacterized protein n=1 Tax=Lactuca saligna TaxID=75948 RepID=A0AA36EFD3_LACSI|nr:unnamed protein product [Lactuca saligna]
MLYHLKIDLVEVLPPPVFKRRVWELVGLLLVDGGNVGVQEGRSNALTQKRWSLLLVPSSDEEREYDDAVLSSRKARWIVSGARLLGSIRDILGSQFYVLKQRKVVVVLSCLGPHLLDPLVRPWDLSHSPTFEAYDLGWEIIRDSLLSEDTIAYEWSRCVHPPATISFLVGQPSAHMADDLSYAAAQTFALMVAATDQVRLASASQGKLKVLQGALANTKEEDVCEACEAIGFEKVRQLDGCTTSSGKSEVPGPGQVVIRAKEVNTALTSIAEMDFVGLFRLGELDYDGFCHFCGKLSLGGSSSDSKG